MLHAAHAATLDGLFHFLAEGGSIAAFKGVFPAFHSLAGAAGPRVTSSTALHPRDHACRLADSIASLYLVEVSHRFPSAFRLCVTEFPSVATFTVTVGISCVWDLAATVFAGQAAAGVEKLPLLVTQGTTVTLCTLAAVWLSVQWDALSMDALAALAGVGSRLVTVRPAPAWLAVAHWSLDPIRLADAM